VNGSVGMAVRIASVRRAAPQTTPRAPALMAAEVPIITVELALVAIFSFTLVAPLGVPLWVPALIIALMAGLVAVLRRVSDRHRPYSRRPRCRCLGRRRCAGDGDRHHRLAHLRHVGDLRPNGHQPSYACGGAPPRAARRSGTDLAQPRPRDAAPEQLQRALHL